MNSKTTQISLETACDGLLNLEKKLTELMKDVQTLRAYRPPPEKPIPGEEALRKQLATTHQKIDVLRDGLEEQVKRIKAQAEQLHRYRIRLALSVAGDSPRNLDDLRDAVELLPLQVDVKKAHLQAAKGELASAKQRLQWIEILKKAYKRAVSADDFEEAKLKVVTAAAQVPFREAELKEIALRVQQVERRLKKKPVAKAPDLNSTPTKRDDGLLNLEKKLTELLKDVETLRAYRPPTGMKPTAP